MRPRGASAFTLVEVLLALVLLAALLAALNQFIFSITELWTQRQERFVFAQHARAVSRRINTLLETAAGSARRSGVTAGAAAPAGLLLPDGGNETLLAFDLPGGDPLMIWPERPLPEVRCALGWNRADGLVLYWKSRLELDFDTAPSRKAVLSPFVTTVSYDYYDATTQTWETEDALRATGATVETPARVRLVFQRKKESIEEIIALPDPTAEGLPAY